MLRVSEIFGPTIQGEGLVIGQPTIFVRLGGCDYRCTWCDTLYAVLPEYRPSWPQMSEEAIVARVSEFAGERRLLVTISGGNPAVQNLSKLLDELHGAGFTTVMETQGSVYREWIPKLTQLCVSPKPPSSGMDTDWEVLDKVVHSHPNAYLKVVVFDERDYDYALGVHSRYLHTPFVLQSGTQTALEDTNRDLTHATLDKLKWLSEKFVSDLAQWRNDVRVLPQMHSLIWGRKRGV